MNEALRVLYLSGSEIQLDERRISRTELKNLDLRIRDKYGLIDYDYELIDFLVCYELGFNEKIVPNLQKRGTLKTIGGSVLVYAARRLTYYYDRNILYSSNDRMRFRCGMK